MRRCCCSARAAPARRWPRWRFIGAASQRNGPFIADQLQRHPGEPARERAVRAREGRIHRRPPCSARDYRSRPPGGTLFLDEIGELRRPIQVKLLRFLQEQAFMRGRRTKAEIRVDTRVIAATNADLKQAIANGTFREDLYFRLAVVVINLPPLRERGDDAEAACEAFLDRFGARTGNRPGLTSRPMRYALRSSSLARQRSRTPESISARRHHGRWQTHYGRAISN